MTDFVSMTCPACGGKLGITKDIKSFICQYCGNEFLVRRGDGIISLSPIADDIRKVRVGVDKTASELAIKRIPKELVELESSRKKIAWELTTINYDIERLSRKDYIRRTRNIFLVLTIVAFIFFCISTALNVAFDEDIYRKIISITFLGWLVSGLVVISEEILLAKFRKVPIHKLQETKAQIETNLQNIDEEIASKEHDLRMHQETVN